MSNTERQQKFRAAHPGYFRKYHGRDKAIARAVRARNQAAARAAVVARAAAEAAEAALATRPPLMLPAPAEPLLFPDLYTLDATSAPSPLPVAQPVKIAA